MKTKSFFILIIINLCFLSNSINAQHSWQWTITDGGKHNESINAIDYDDSGNIYLTGTFQDTSSLFGKTVISKGREDIFIASIKPDGSLNWLKHGGGVWEDSGIDICIDHNFVYVVGFYRDQISIGDTLLNSAGTLDVLVVKYDLNGDFLWAESAGGVNEDVGKSIAADDSGNVAITGDINYIAKFGEFTVSYVKFSDMFVAKYNSEGVCQWATSGGGSIYDSGEFVEIANNGDVIVSGSFNDQATFDTITVSSTEYADVFIARYSSDGAVQEVVSAGGPGNEAIQCMAIDSSSNIYIAGWYMDNITIGSEKHYSSGVYDIFIAKYKPGSDFIWSKSYGGSGIDIAETMNINAENDIYITGTFEQSVDFGLSTFNSEGFEDGFLSRFDTSGSLEWVYQIGGTGSLDTRDCAVDMNENLYVAGVFIDELNIGGTSFTPTGGNDLFLAKFAESTSIREEHILVINSNCYPNPFIGSIAILYTLKQKGKVSLKVYNCSGNLMRVVINEIQNTGKHVVDFNGFNLPSGIYFYILETEEGICTRKMVKL
ncbi:MAG: T9SS type A sorting domain-containing protein [Bacteroidales bacterium]|nr:T9SS type A sorting domain-containing protein [Bacteroidales bacterium]